MRVSRYYNVVSDLVVVEVLEGAVAVGLIAIPCIVVEGIGVAIDERFVLTGENSLTANDAPHRPTFSRLAKLVVEPVLLA